MVAQSKDDFPTGASGIDPAADRQQPWGGDLDRLLRQLVEKLASTTADGSKGGGASGAYEARLLPVVLPHGAGGVHAGRRARERFRSLWTALLQSAAANGAASVDAARNGARRFVKTVDPFAPPVALFLAGVLAGAAATIYSAGGREHDPGASVGEATVGTTLPSIAPQATPVAIAAPVQAPPSAGALEKGGSAASPPVDSTGKASSLAYAPPEQATPGAPVIRPPIKPRARVAPTATAADPASPGRARANASPEKRSAAQTRRPAQEQAPVRVKRQTAPASAAQPQPGANRYGYISDTGVEGIFSAMGKKLDSLVPR